MKTKLDFLFILFICMSLEISSQYNTEIRTILPATGVSRK